MIDHAAVLGDKGRAAQEYRDVLTELATDIYEPGSFAAFVKLVWHTVEPESRPLGWAPYLDVLCHELQLSALGDSTRRHLLINIPPGHAKSLLTCVFVPSWIWWFDPSRRFLFFSAADVVGYRDARRMRDVVTSPVYNDQIRRFGGRPVVLRDDAKAVGAYVNQAMGSRHFLSMNSVTTGTRADDLGIDDPIDVKEVTRGGPEAIARRLTQVNETIEQVIETRVNSPKTSRITMIMQRLHEDDPAARFAQRPGVRAIVLPMQYGRGEADPCDADPREVEGEILAPHLHDEGTIEHLRKTLGAQQAAAQLDQSPRPTEGNEFLHAWVADRCTLDPVEVAEACAWLEVSIDAAKKANTNSDYHAMHVWAYMHVPGRGTRYVLIDRVHGQYTWPTFQAAAESLISKWSRWLREKGLVRVEDQAHGTTLLQTMGPVWDGIPFVAFQPSTHTPGKDKSKAARFTYLVRAGSSGAIWVMKGPTFDQAVASWTGFPLAKHDDDCDAASQTIMMWTLEPPVRGGLLSPRGAGLSLASEQLLADNVPLNRFFG